MEIRSSHVCLLNIILHNESREESRYMYNLSLEFINNLIQLDVGSICGVDELMLLLDLYYNRGYDTRMLTLFFSLLDAVDAEQFSDENINQLIITFFNSVQNKEELQKFIKWMIDHDMSIHKKYIDTLNETNYTIADHYITSIYCEYFDDDEKLIRDKIDSSVIDNVNMFCDHGIKIEKLCELALIIAHVDNIAQIRKLFLRLEKQFETMNIETINIDYIDQIRCSILLSGCTLNHDEICRIINSTGDLKKLYLFNGVNKSIMMALLAHRQLDDQIFNLLINKCTTNMSESEICLLLTNKNLELEMLQKISFKSTQTIIEQAVKNEHLDGSIYRFLIKINCNNNNIFVPLKYYVWYILA